MIDYKHFDEKIQKKKSKSDLFSWVIFTLLVVMLWLTAIHYVWK
jgi:predicted nucleic acid-binding Zn ribbon protein